MVSFIKIMAGLLVIITVVVMVMSNVVVVMILTMVMEVLVIVVEIMTAIECKCHMCWVWHGTDGVGLASISVWLW